MRRAIAYTRISAGKVSPDGRIFLDKIGRRDDTVVTMARSDRNGGTGQSEPVKSPDKESVCV